MRLKIIFVLLFILTYGTFFYSNSQTKNERINFDLNKQIKILENHYNLTMDYFLQDVKSMRNNLTNNNKVTNLFSQAQNATNEERVILRKKIYNLLLPMYKRISTRGILQFQFVFPNNKSFIRMHKIDKYGDNLTDIRYSFRHVNKTKQTVICQPYITQGI